MKSINLKQICIRIVILFCYVQLFVHGLAEGVTRGGRYNLLQPIAMADRFLAGKGLFYSATDASTPYLPGVSFLAIVVGKCLFAYRDYILLFIAAAVVCFLLYQIVSLTNIQVGDNWLVTIIVFTLFNAFFYNFKFHAFEFKTDALITALGICIVKMICKCMDDDKVPYILLFFLSLFLNIFKQQSLYIDAGICAFIVLNKKFDLKRKLRILVTLGIAALIDLLIIVSVKGYEIQTILNLKQMPFFEAKKIAKNMIQALPSNAVIIVLCLICVELVVTKKVKLKPELVAWVFASSILVVAQTIGGAKIGGGNGNYQAGLVAAMPYAVIALISIMDMVVNCKIRKTFSATIVCLFVCIVICYSSFNTLNSLKVARRAINENSAASSYLSQKVGDGEIMYNSDMYMIVCRANLEPGMDVYSLPRFVESEWGTLDEALAQKKYEYLLVPRSSFEAWENDIEYYFGRKVYYVENLDANYEQVQDDNMPSKLQGLLYKVKD